MKRTLFAVACGVSFLLCLATLGLWVQSLGHFASMLWSRPDHVVELYSIDGVIGLTATRDSRSRSPFPGGGLYGRSCWRNKLPPGRDRASLITPAFNRFGFGWHVVKTESRPDGIWRTGNQKLVVAYFPFWLVAAITALLPLRWLALFLRRRRDPQGYCLSCGYNLTGNATGICPECGMTRDEALGQRALRIRRTKRALIVASSLVLIPIVGHTAVQQYRDHLAWKDLLARQQHYLDYNAPADLIVYTEDPLVGRRLGAGDPNYVPIGRSACYVPKVLQEIPGLHIGKNGGPILFLHGRQSSDGTTRLVGVGLMSLEDREDLCSDVLVPASDDETYPRPDRQSDLEIGRRPQKPITFMAGQPDPADASHFTIRYSIEDQSGTIEGWLMDGGLVKMRVRDGPARPLSVMPMRLPANRAPGRTPPGTTRP